MKNTILTRTAWLVLSFSALLPALAAQTAVLSVQGVLRKNDGKAVDDGTYTLKFKLWKHPTSTSATDKVWEDSFTDVEITGGVYNVLLGTGFQPLDAPFDQPYYLGVSMSSGSELQPRPLLTSAPFVLSLQGQSNILPSVGPMGVGTARPDTTSAILAVESTEQGVLIPKMTLTQRNAIAAPAAGLLVFQTNVDPGFYFYNGSAWLQISSLNVPNLTLGAFHEGGYIIYLDATGQHGLVAAASNLTISPTMGTATKWYWRNAFEDHSSETQGTQIGSGKANTRSVMQKATDKEEFLAAYVCDEFVSAEGYSDWFLPSKDELNLIYVNLKLQGIGGFGSGGDNVYWSSSEYDDGDEDAWTQDFTTGVQAPGGKTSPNFVRPVRAF
ncbi:MAG: DUF1566 domain-containing protein [Saprospiraceae bacterium]|nr:DUF1566 domain-containing protein [Saprospiraceae bacterium]